MRGHPFQSPDARRLALLFAIVYFAQGMIYLPEQVLAIVLKERGLSAGQLAAFNWIIAIPWFIKPLYGLLSDFVPLFGTRRRSYSLIMSSLAAFSALTVSLMPTAPYAALATMITLLWLGVGFTDVLTDALMVENGKPLGLTGGFQSVQRAAISAASILVGVAGGYLAEHRGLGGAFALVACFPLISFLMATLVVREPPARPSLEGFGETWEAIRLALRRRDLWGVAGFIFFWTFSPSFGPAFFYYQTDVLGFSQTFIGTLASLGAAAGIAGAAVYNSPGPEARAEAAHRLVDRRRRARHSRLSRLPGRRVGRRRHAGLRRDRHDHPPRVLGPGGQGLPTRHGGHVLRAPDVGLQPGDAQRGVDRRQPLRLGRLCSAGADRGRLHRGGLAARPPHPDRRDPGRRAPGGGGAAGLSRAGAPAQVFSRSSRSTACLEDS
jgi:MFS family permease